MIIEPPLPAEAAWLPNCTEEEDVDVGIKVVVVGNGAVGKSSLIQRYCCGTFKHAYSRTIGADFLERRTTVGGKRVQLMVWDTAGQEEFATITRAYYRGAACCIVAFSTTDSASLAAVKRWHQKVEQECGQIPTVLVQTKIDRLGHPPNINQSEAEELSEELGLRLFRTSALEDHNVGAVFEHLTEKYLDLISKSVPVLVPLSKDMFGAADKLRRGDTIILRSKKKSKFKHFSRPTCFVL